MSSNKIRSILLVDDSPADVYLAEHYIQAAEICDNITVCSNGQEAFDFLIDFNKKLANSDDAESNFPAMILLDINMPGLDGFGFLEKIKKSELNGPCGQPFTVVMLSTSDFSGDVSRAEEYQQVAGYITKPLLETHGPMLLRLNEQNSGNPN